MVFVKKQRMQEFIQATYKDGKTLEQDVLDMELQAATASILGETFTDFEQNVNYFLYLYVK